MNIATTSTSAESEAVISDPPLHPDRVVGSLPHRRTETVSAAEPLISQNAAFELGQVQIVRDFRTAVPLLFSDVLVAVGCLLIAAVADFLIGGPVAGASVSAKLTVVALVIFLQALNGLYPACGMKGVEEFDRCLKTCLAVLAIGCLFSFAAFSAALVLTSLLFFFSLFGLLWTARQAVRHVLAEHSWWTQPVVFVGDLELALQCHSEAEDGLTSGLRPAGVVCNSIQSSYWLGTGPDPSGVLAYGVENLQNVLLSNKVSRICTVSNAVLDYGLFRGIPRVMMPTGLASHPVIGSRLSDGGDGSQILCRSGITCPASTFSKRAFDVILTLVTVPFWGVIMGTIAIVLKLSVDPGPIFYRQKRVGRFGKPFNALKFRSMISDADSRLKAYLEAHPEARLEWESTHKLKDDPRVTRLGRFLRSSSLDELPQLFNVLRGDMSLVGPRPIVDCDQYDRLYIDQHPEVFDLYKMVRPGITGLWQISGRNGTSYLQRVSYDREYLHNWSLHLDVFILWRTVKTALLREGAY